MIGVTRMNFVGDIFRPPSEAQSILLQLTVGCSHNACSFCGMYRSKRFSIKSQETVFADIDEASQRFIGVPRLFLCDGDALVLSFEKLEPVLRRIRERMPWVRRISTYADSKSIIRKSANELTALRELGLSLVYQGVESGSDSVLAAVNKGSTAADALRAATLLREAGITHSVMFLIGLGGESMSEEHAAASGRLLSQINPRFASALTLTLVPGTPLYNRMAAGNFRLPDRFALLQELRTLLANTTATNCQFSANHASNYLPLTGRLPFDKQKLLTQLDDVLAQRDAAALVPEWMRGL
jgi:radical SAM superfamily enzyme YgiQ (UPF0313 family)